MHFGKEVILTGLSLCFIMTSAHAVDSRDKQSKPGESAMDKWQMTNMMRQGSGTSWQPENNPMLMWMGQYGPWTTMAHGSAFLDYTNQGGKRGREKIVSQNWIMGSASRTFGEKNLIQLRGMFSAEPLTEGIS